MYCSTKCPAGAILVCGDSLYLDVKVIREFTSLNAGACRSRFWDNLRVRCVRRYPSKPCQAYPHVGFVYPIKIVHVFQVDIDFNYLVPGGVGSRQYVAEIVQTLFLFNP